MWMMPLHLHVNQKSDYDYDDDESPADFCCSHDLCFKVNPFPVIHNNCCLLYHLFLHFGLNILQSDLGP